jgi:capsular exopolysaccharide synthesis family protein
VTFKDLLRLLRRRWLTALLGSLMVIAGFTAYSTIKERPTFRARARVLISAPPLFVSAQTNQWVAIETKDINTWIAIIRSGKVLGPAREQLKKELPGFDPSWADSVGVTAEGQQLVWIEATAPTGAQAAAVANAVAKATEAYDRAETAGELEEAIRKAKTQIDEQAKVQEKELAAARRERDAAKTRLAAESLELDVRKLQEDILGHETRRRDVERRLSTNRLRLERVGADRSAVEHLQREVSPRTASAQLRIYENPRVRAATERLEGLHRDLNSMRRRYTEEHPQVKNARADLREAELALTRTQIEALGRDMDAEELGIRADSELGLIELRVLEPELRELRLRLADLAPYLERAVAHERLAADAKARQATLESLRAQFETAPTPSYVRELETAKSEEAVPVELRLRKSWPVALLAGVIVGLSLAFLLDFVDTSLRTDYDVKRHLDFPVLAVIPKVDPEEILTVRAAPASVVAELFDTLATVLLSTPAPQPSRLFLVTSTNPQEGKTAVSIDLAVALARQGKRTLLVDGDMRVPAVHTSLGLPNDLGLSSLLGGQVTLETEGLLHEVEVQNLRVLPSGISPENPYELLDPARVAVAAAQMRESYDAIVVDTPPVLRTGDALKFSSAADAVLFVVESGKTDQRQATWAKRLLSNVNAKVAGVVLNRAQRESEEYYYYYGGRRGRREVRV